MQQQFSIKKVLNFLLFVIVTCFLLYACAKADLSRKPKEDFSKFDRTQLVEMVSKDILISNILAINSEIRNSFFDNSGNPFITSSDLLKISQQRFTKPNEIANAYMNAGLKNYYDIVSLIERELTLSRELVVKYSFLIEMGKEKSDTFIKEVLDKAYKKSNLNYIVNDECSESYAAGMNACDRTYGIHLIATGLGTIIATAIGSPAGGASTALIAYGASYADYISCRVSVVDQWKICRKYHPIVH